MICEWFPVTGAMQLLREAVVTAGRAHLPGAWAMAGGHLKQRREGKHSAAPRSEYSRGSGRPAARKAACEPQLSAVTQLSVLPAATRRGRAPDAVPVTFFSKTQCGDRACF